MKKYLYIFSFTFCMITYGQNEMENGRNLDDAQFIISWDIALPTDNDFLDKTSVYGVRFEYRVPIAKQLDFGLALGWNSYRQRIGEQLYEVPDGSRAVFTDMIRKVFEMPVTTNILYNFNSSGGIRPYIGIGIGTLYSQQNVYFNIYEISENNWGFLVRPEFGVQFDFNRDMGLQIYGNYNYATNTNDSFRIDSLEHIAFGLGFYWGL